jgi:lipopolysaccharide transport system ATP-binding protein
MSDPVLEVQGVSRVFRIYSSPKERLLAAFHLDFIRKPKFRELWALREINLRVLPGDRLGILGRNGAGKSTLLKIVCGNLEPTEGSVRVRGKIQALLELGTGFHPDFSGRENVSAFLAYQGITGKEARSRADEACEFSELEDFLDLPVKTYSSGMYARLAFSAATAIDPEVLIIDEVLGAGDAYFAGKCLERMKQLTSKGATVLFVSHDLASVQLLCDRAIWVDSGRIVAQGDCLEISRRYLAEVRREEEERLRAVNRKLRKRSIGSLQRSEELHEPLLFHFVVDSAHPFEEHLFFRLTLKEDNETLREIIVGDAMDNEPSRGTFVYDEPGLMDWSPPRSQGGRRARAFRNCGGRYTHAPFQFAVPIGKVTEDASLCLEVEYLDSSQEPVHVEVYDGDVYLRIGTLSTNGGGQVKVDCFTVPTRLGREAAEVPPPGPEVKDADAADGSDVWTIPSIEGYGSAEGRITAFRLLDEKGKPRQQFEIRTRMTARIEYVFLRPVPKPVFTICIYRADGTCVSQVFCSVNDLWRQDCPMSGWLEAVFDPLLLGRGHYSVSVAIFHHLDLADPREPPTYHLLDRFFRFQVVQPPGVNVELGALLLPVSWVEGHAVNDVSTDRVK